MLGVLETVLFAKFDMALIEPLELSVAVVVGMLAGLAGCAIRIKGTVV